MRIDIVTLGRRIQRLLVASCRRFRRDNRGTAAIEFGIVALPFLALLFAIIETGLVFLGGQVLETAVADSARLILTGQAQTGGFDNATSFKNAVCKRITGLLDCQAGVYIDVRKFPAFDKVSLPAPTYDKDGKMTNTAYQQSSAGDIVVVRLMYQFPIYLQLWNSGLANAPGNKRLLVATAAFQNEPF